jgi:hypothetical protein
VSWQGLRVATTVIATLVGVGLLCGLAWWLVAPRPGFRVEADGLYFLNQQPQEYIAADGWFALITVPVGLLAGMLVWRSTARAATGGLVGLALGALAGAAAAAAVGVFLGSSDPFSQPVGSLAEGALELRAWSVLLLEAGAAIGVWLVLDLLVLRPEPVEDTPLPNTFEQPVHVRVEPDPRPPGYGSVHDL